MGVIARPALVPPLPWRSIGILVILGLVLVAGAVLLLSAGTQRLPEPFGPARNGSILYGTPAGDIHSVDPVSGASHPIVAGPMLDNGPVMSRDGTRFLFVRATDGPAHTLYVANVDGSGVRQLFEGEFGLSILIDGQPHPAEAAPFSWSPDGAHVAVTSTVDLVPRLTVVATDGSDANTLDLGMSVSGVNWRPNGQLVFVGAASAASGKTYGLYLVNADGTGLRPILPANSLEFGWQSPTVSADGTRVAFALWGDPPNEGIHVAGIDSGSDRVLDFEGQSESQEFLPQFSPDGTKLAFAHFTNGEYQLAVVPAAGGGRPIAMGPRFSEGTDGPFQRFSPDGTSILASYPADGSTWLLDTDGRDDRQMSWPKGQFPSWQRLAP